MTEKTVEDILTILQEELPEIKTSLALLKRDVETTKNYCAENGRALRGSNNNPGLMEEVRKLMDWKKSVKYWYVLLVGVTVSAIMVGVVNIIIELGSKVVNP